MKTKLAIALTASVLAGGVSAWEAGDMFVRAGSATVSPDESSDGIAIPALGVPAMAGTEAQVDSDTQLGLTFNYMYSNKLGIEVLAATPFTHDIDANLGDVVVPAGEATHLPPTISLVYYPMADNGSNVQPYVGAGINYTIFFEEDVSMELEELTGVLADAGGPVPLELELDDSVGLALQAGVDVMLDDKWHLNASVRWIDINTDAEFTSPALNGATVITVDDVEIDPWVYQINVGYKF